MNGLIARSEWLKPDKPGVDPNLEEKVPPQECGDSVIADGTSSKDWDLVGAQEEDSF